MKKKKLSVIRILLACILTTAVVVDLGVLSVEKAEAASVVVTPTELTGVLKNPGKGWVLYNGSGNLTAQTTARASVGYNRFNWIDLEPTEGNYNWSIIDSAIATYASYGMKFAFGVMADNTCSAGQYITPQWVFADGAASTTGTVSDCNGSKLRTTPVWNDPIFLAKYRAMLTAIAARYDGSPDIAWINVLSYGNWGELGASSYFQGSKDISESDFQSKHLQMFLDVFSKTQLIAITNGGLFSNAFDWAVQQGMGLQRCGIPDNSDGSEVTPAYGHAPGVIEWTGSWTANHYSTSTLATDDAVAKASYENMGQWGSDAVAFLTDEQAYIDSEQNKLGYHFVLTSATVPGAITNGTTYQTSLTWNNKGLNYSYEPMRFAYALLDASNNVVAKYFPDTGANPQRLAPGTTTETPNLTFSGVAPGVYKLAFGIFKDTSDANPTYNVAITGRTSNGWYPLNSVTVSGSGVASSYPRTYEAEFMTPTFTMGKHDVHVRDANASSGMTDKFNSTGIGQSISYPVNITQTGAMDVRVRVNENVLGGNFQLSVDGVNVGPPIYTYASSSTYAEVDLGSLNVGSTGVKQFKFTSVGTSVSNYTLTLDYIRLGSSGGKLVDNLNDWSLSYSHSPNVTFDTTNSTDFGGDPSRAARTTSTNEDVVWQLPGATSFQASTYFWSSEPVSPFTLLTSSDGATWNTASPTVTAGSGNFAKYVYTLSNMTNTNFVKMVWNNTSGTSWNPQIGQVTLTSPPTELAGSSFGTAGTWNPPSDTYDKVFDGDTSTFFDSTTASGAYAGIDLGSGGAARVDSIKFCPRVGYEGRMVGGRFQGSNSGTNTGFTDLYTVTSQPNPGCTRVNISDQSSYQYLRYIGGTDSYGNVAEVEFWGQ